MDATTEKRIKLLHPKIRDEVLDLVNKANKATGKDVTIRIVQGYRTIEEQNILYALGRTVKNPVGASPRKPLGNIVTNARGGSSYHNYGLAIDFAFLIKNRGIISWDTRKDWDNDTTADWLEVVRIFLKAGYKWGGNFSSIKDYPHLEKTFGYNWRTLFAKYKRKDFIPNTKYVNI